MGTVRPKEAYSLIGIYQPGKPVKRNAPNDGAQSHQVEDTEERVVAHIGKNQRGYGQHQDRRAGLPGEVNRKGAVIMLGQDQCQNTQENISDTHQDHKPPGQDIGHAQSQNRA